MSEMAERFGRRRDTLAKVHSRAHLIPVGDPLLVEQVLLEPIDWSSIHEVELISERQYSFDFDVTVSDGEVESLLAQLRGQFDSQKFDDLTRSCRDMVLSNIIKPFGLARVLFTDHDGGNVTTELGARKAFEDKSFKVAAGYDREDYVSSRVRKNMDSFKEAKVVDGMVRDEYSIGESWVRVEDADTDHIVSAAEYHSMGGFMQGEEKKQRFAGDERNYAITENGINRSKGSENGRDWQDQKGNGRDVSNKEYFETDGRKVGPAVTRGTSAARDHLPTNTEKLAYYTRETLSTGAKEAAKMGTQQAVGLMLHELVSAIFAEVKDIYANGYKGGRPDSTFFEVLKKRLTRVAKRVAARWKDATQAFTQGALSGFISNLVTVVVNKFIATGKRIVRIIREGFFSLLRALKLIVSPPEGMSSRQACHEATKLIATGLTIAGGLLLEEGVEGYLMGQLAGTPLAAIVPAASAVCVGMATGLVSVFLVYALDKIDLFGAEREARHTHIMDTLGNHLDVLFQESDELLASMDLA